MLSRCLRAPFLRPASTLLRGLPAMGTHAAPLATLQQQLHNTHVADSAHAAPLGSAVLPSTLDVDDAVAQLHDVCQAAEDGRASLEAVVETAVPLVATIAQSASTAATPVRVMHRMLGSRKVASSGAGLAVAWGHVLQRAAWSGQSALVVDVLAALGKHTLRLPPAAIASVADASDAAAYAAVAAPGGTHFAVLPRAPFRRTIPAADAFVPPALDLGFESPPDATPLQWQAMVRAAFSLCADATTPTDKAHVLRCLGATGMVRRAFAVYDDLAAAGAVGDDVTDALFDACRVAGHPNRALKLFQVLRDGGKLPSLRAVGHLLATLGAARRPEGATVLAACLDAGMTPPSQFHLSVMASVAGSTPAVMDHLQVAQSCGHFDTVDKHLWTKGFVNVSGLPPALISSVLSGILTAVRHVVATEGHASAPPQLVVFVSSKTRSHTKQSLAAAGLTSRRRNWCLEVDPGAWLAFVADAEP